MITGLFAELSKYRVVTRLGSGGMADVYLVLSERPGGFSKLQVLKLMRSDLSEQERPEFLQMFQDEARLAARLNHPNIVQCFEVGAEDGQPFIVMEYLEGQTLHRVQQRARHLGRGFSVDMELFVLCQVLEGLEYAHHVTDYAGNPLHIVHRDVSPQNVFVCYSGQSKLVDFGVAKTLESSKTRAGVVKGKVAYMPPEQVASGPIDHRADLFSVGVLLWEAIAGAPMHAELSVFESMSRLLRGDLPKLREAAPNVSPELERIVQRALEIDPDKRYQDAETFRTELLAYLESSSRVRARDVGNALAQLFARERGELSEIIRRAMSTSTPPPEDKEASVRPITRRLPVAADPLSSDPTAAAPLQHTPTTLAAETPAMRNAHSTPSAKTRVPALLRGWRLSGLSLLLICGVTTFFVVRSESSDARSVAMPETVVSPASLPGDGPPPDVAPPPPAAEVQLAIEVEPKIASIQLDGRPLGVGSYRGRERRDRGEHTLSVSAPGYTALRRSVHLDADLELALKLEKTPAEPSTAKAEPRHPARPQRPLLPPTAATNNAEPYVDLPAPKRIRAPGAPKLDQEDPWADSTR
jgi:eukaryotic-like serine/threonine-protein kinase